MTANTIKSKAHNYTTILQLHVFNADGWLNRSKQIKNDRIT